MDLNRYDNRLIRITDKYDRYPFYGLARSYPSEYGLHEFGREEDSIKLGGYQLFESDIDRIEELPDYQLLTPEYDADLANIIRVNLKARHLDIPGTVYYDDCLDHLSDFYSRPDMDYYILVQDGVLLGGIGFAKFDGFDNCAELQKLYLSDEVKGNGYGYAMIDLIENKAEDRFYEKMYLETHTNLQAAIHIYEKSGYKLIERPESVVHSTMNRFYLKELV